MAVLDAEQVVGVGGWAKRWMQKGVGVGSWLGVGGWAQRWMQRRKLGPALDAEQGVGVGGWDQHWIQSKW